MRSPLAALRRYYPGFFGALFLVLLRIAIGWHFLYEGTQKILSTPEGKDSILARYLPASEGPPFSSEGYLRGATGPLAPRFRSLIPDVDARGKLDLDSLDRTWSREADMIGAHFRFDEQQLTAAGKIKADRRQVAFDWFQSVENREKVRKYLDELAEIEAIENNPKSLEYERENARRDRKSADVDRKELTTIVDAWTGTLRDSLTALANKEQVNRYGKYTPEAGPLVLMDRFTMYSLTAIGLCLMLGLFTPLAALGGATFLLSIYLSSPPWPGLPEVGPGHYRYVNLPLIEMLACLALASTPSGLWIGLDSLLFGWIGRGKRAHETAPAAEPIRPARPEPQDRRKFKNR